MNRIIDRETHEMRPGLAIDPIVPLYQRAPNQDEHGKALTDFMMVIPRLRHQPPRHIQTTIGRIETVLTRYSESVVFADLNLKINVLFVVTRPVAGICLELPVALNEAVPEALLVAQPRFF